MTRPTLEELILRVKGDLESRIGSTGGVLRRSFIAILARVIAGGFHLLYGFLEWVLKQLFVTTCSPAYVPIHGAIYKIQRGQATFARFKITLTGTDGSQVLSGTRYKRSDDIEFEVEETVTIASGTAEATVICLTEGATGNTDAAVILNAVSPVLGVDGQATVGDAVEVADDQEDIEAYRARILERIQSPPHGGNEADYVAWAKEITGVTRVWVYGGEFGPGTVGVAFVMDGRENIVPEASDVQTVQDHINEEAPVTADVTVYAPVTDAIDFTISGLSPNDQAVKDAIEAELVDLIRRDGEPDGTILISRIREAISTAAGEQDHVLVSPNANYQANGLPIMGEVTYT